MSEAARDQNRVTTLLGVSSADGTTPLAVQVDPTTGAILVDITGAGSGDVSGPGSSTDNAVVRWDGAAGTDIQNSAVIIDDSNNVTGIVALTASGAIRSNTSLIVEETGAGTDTITIQAPASITASYSLTLPVDDGAAGEVLSTDGSGVLSWSAAGSGDVTAAGALTDNAVVRGDGGVKGVQTSSVLIDDTDNVSGMATLTLPNTGLHLLDSNATHDLVIVPGSDLTVDRNFTITTGDAARTLSMAGNITTAADFITSGANSLTLTTSGATNVTLPTTGTLVNDAVTTLSSLVSIGTITTGVWNATDVPVSAGGTGLSTISALSIWVANSANVVTEVTPGAGNSIRVNGAGNAWEAFTPSASVPTAITVANEATDTSCFPLFVTAATGDLGPKSNANLIFNSNTGEFGAGSVKPISGDGGALGDTTLMWSDLFLASGSVINFNAGDVTLTHSAEVLTLAGGSLVLPDAGLTVGASIPFSDAAGTLTLQNVDALDPTTESTVEAAIDTLANLVSIQGRTVTLADAGANAIFGWDDVAGAYENLLQSEVLAVIGSSSTTAQGVVEIAIASEVNTGTDATRAVSPDALAGSNLGTQPLGGVAFNFTTDVATGDGKFYIPIPAKCNGMNLIRANAYVITAGTTNATTVMVHNLTQAADMLSGAISIASGGTIGTPGTIDTANDDVATDDIIRIDVDSVSTTAPKGLLIMLELQLP